MNWLYPGLTILNNFSQEVIAWFLKINSKNDIGINPMKVMKCAANAEFRRDLGFDESVAETILNLRSQVIELQSQIRELETELNAQFASQNIRLAAYREVYNDAIWIEIKLQE